MADDPNWVDEGTQADNSQSCPSQPAMDTFYNNFTQMMMQSTTYRSFFENNSTHGTSACHAMSDSSRNCTQSDSRTESGEVSSPSKKRKSIGDSRVSVEKKGKRMVVNENEERQEEGRHKKDNKRWESDCSDFALEYLADMATKGYKVDKSFKRTAFESCANAVNQKFNMNYTADNVYNHLRTLKNKWNHWRFIRGLSGAGFDDEQKMIILAGKPLEDFKLAHPKLTCYINKPLKLYEELRVVAGEDQVTGSYRKGIYQAFGQESVPSNVPLVHIDDDIQAPVDVEEEGGDGGDTSRTNASTPRQASSTPRVASNTRPNSRKKRMANDGPMDLLIEKVGSMTSMLAEEQEKRKRNELRDAVYSLHQFDVRVLNNALRRLLGNSEEAIWFVTMNGAGREAWMEDFQANYIG